MAGKELLVMVKFIDAANNLSIQVHPYAKAKANDNGKTEIWIVLEHEPDAFVYLGVRRQTTKKAHFEAIQADDIDKVSSEKFSFTRETFFIPAGTIHAIGGVICALQQRSNIYIPIIRL